MKLFILGSYAIDELGYFKGRFQDLIKNDLIEKLSLSFVVEGSEVSFGGCAGNIAYGLAQVGATAELCGFLGKDGTAYYEHLKALGMGLDHLKMVQGQTARAVITSDLEGAQIAHFNPGVIGKDAASFDLPTEAKSGDLFLVAPENPQRMKEAARLAKEAGLQVYIDLGQVIHVFAPEELKTFLGGSAGVFVNEYEWDLLKSLSGESQNEILNRTPLLVLTKGAQGVELLTRDTQSSFPAFPADVQDATGAGDAFRAGFLAALLEKRPLESCIRLGMLLAAQSVEHRFAQGYTLDEERKALMGS